MNPFWIVVNNERGPSIWPFRHASESEATTEAARLCRQNGGEFFVMEAKSLTKKMDVVTEKMTSEDPPF